jgi:ABC-type Fe3+/spermidine/putrescine transport system ATPase subunit
LDDVTLQVKDKEYVCIVGPSGCGKSTLIKCVAGIIQPDRGEILIDGKSVAEVAIEDRKIGYVFQDIALFPHLTVRDNVSYGLSVRHAPSERTSTVTNEMLDLINMRERAKSFPRELSGGAQQKVAVGRAIATGSHLFLLDEPLGALDALVRTELRYELKRLASDLGLTIIHVTHDQEEALSIADRVFIMKRGRIVEVGKPSEIYHLPRTLFTENFVGETNLFEGEVEEANETYCLVVTGPRKVRLPYPGKSVGQRVIVAIRPELVQLKTENDVSSNGWTGRIAEVTFLGSITRYTVELNDGLNFVAHVQGAAETDGFRVGEKVELTPDLSHTLLFDYPKEGLEEEIALE